MIETAGGEAQKLVTIYDDIYDLADCRAYYRAMQQAGFRTAHYAAAGFRAVLAELRRVRGLGRAGIVDFASGYGIAAALMRHDLSLNDVLTRYQDPWFDDADTAAMIAADRDWYAGARPAGAADWYAGIDIAANALNYGRAVGIFDRVFAEDLAAEAPSEALAGTLADCDLIVECGSIAHMLPRALDRVLTAAVRRPWVATAPIRGNDSAEAIAVLKNHGLTVEWLGERPFPHRRFANADEQARGVANAEARGYDTAGLERDGYFHAQIILARPPEEATPVAGWAVPVAAD